MHKVWISSDQKKSPAITECTFRFLFFRPSFVFFLSRLIPPQYLLDRYAKTLMVTSITLCYLSHNALDSFFFFFFFFFFFKKKKKKKNIFINYF
jgi:hypothetical protein